VALVDAERTERTARAVKSSAVLPGMSFIIGCAWLKATSEAVARRRGETEVSEQSVLIARVVLGVFANATEGWVQSECREELSASIRRNFEAMAAISADWTRREANAAVVTG
jgi:uncharacterized membrane protein